MLDTTLDENSINDLIGTNEFVTNQLHRNEEIKDMSGLLRPRLMIAGRTVVFKNRMEKIGFEGDNVTIVAPEETPPVHFPLPQGKMPSDPERAADWNKKRIKAVQRDETITELDAYNRAHTEDAPQNLLVVTNTPLGIVNAAIALGTKELIPVREAMVSGQYAVPKAAEIIDSVLAAIAVDDTGKATERYDTNGYAVALAALTGDEKAMKIIAMKRKALYEIEQRRREEIPERGREYLEERLKEGIEPMPLEKLYTVHSTSHAIERDADGNPILRPAGQYLAVPRASLHFTLNSNVYPHAQAEVQGQEAWGNTDRIIITPLTSVIDANSNPEVLNGVDTWWSVNPGEALTLKDAVTIEPASDIDELFTYSDARRIKILIKDHYTPAEQQKIRDLMEKTGAVNIDELKGRHDGQLSADSLREAVVQKVLTDFGLTINERDQPSQHGHGMENMHLATRISMAAVQIGARTATHFNTAESDLEKEGWIVLQQALEMEAAGNHFDFGSTSQESSKVGYASLPALRQCLVNGCMVAVPPTKREEFTEWFA